MKGQPRALYLLNFISMWECFSYYGMRVLLVLFMIHKMHYSDGQAFGLYALYTTLIELGGLVGGFVADRYLGLKRSITLGAWTIALGHLTLAVPDSSWTFFLGLGIIVSGTGLFRSNVAALLGEFYEENDPRRDAGYTLYYTGINLGGFLATVLCGAVGEIYGWHAGFSLAALGMLSGNISLLIGRKLLEGKGENKKVLFSKAKGLLSMLAIILAALAASVAIYNYTYVTPVIPFLALGGIYFAFKQSKETAAEHKQGLKKLLLYVFFLMVFFICEEQLGSSLVLFSERHFDRETMYGVIPAASLITFNPLTILIAGPLLSQVMQKIPLRGIHKIIMSFFLLGAAFCLLGIGCLMANSGGIVPLGFGITSIMVIALGEIFIGPDGVRLRFGSCTPCAARIYYGVGHNRIRLS